MVSERNRIINIISFLNSLGIGVIVAKNKAQGNKGFFKSKYGKQVIHIAKGLSDEETLAVLVHEFAHYLHFTFDNSLKTLDFIFDEYSTDIEEELIMLTVDEVPSDMAKQLFEQKTVIKNQIKEYTNKIKSKYSDFKLSKPYKNFEKIAKNSSLKYLLKYDRVRVLEFFSLKMYSIDNVEKDFPAVDEYVILYIRLKSLQRKMKRINTRISRLNRYYNSKTELFARSMQIYFSNYIKCKKIAPKITKVYDEVIEEKKIELLYEFYNTYKFIQNNNVEKIINLC